MFGAQVMYSTLARNAALTPHDGVAMRICSPSRISDLTSGYLPLAHFPTCLV